MTNNIDDEPPRGWQAPTEEEYTNADKYSDASIFERGTAESAVQWGLWALHQELAEAAKLYRASGLHDRRDAVFASVFAVQRFLKTQGFNEATTEPLMRPALALVEREQNRPDPLFSERKRAGAPARALEEYSKIGSIAALAEAWLQLNKDGEGRVEEKLRRFIRHVEGYWFSNLSPAKVKAAREMVSQEAKDHPAVTWANLYRKMLSEAERFGGPAAAIRTVVRSLNRSRIDPTTED